MEKEFKCPVCESPLSKSKYYEVIGAEKEREELEKSLKKQILEEKKNKEKLQKEKKVMIEKLAKDKIALQKKYKEEFEKKKVEILKKAQEEARKVAQKDLEKLNKEKLELQKKITEEKKNSKKQILEEKAKIQKQFEKEREEILKKAKFEADKIAKKNIDKISKEKLILEKKQRQELKKAQKDFLEKGKEHEKKRTDRLTKMMEGKVKALEDSKKKIMELQEQLKKRTTPQMEGLNLEEELVKLLKEKFPEDYIEHKGHGGDILHYIKYKDKEIGLIVYECKRTQKFLRSYVSQIKNDVVKRNATYGVLVTEASEKGKNGFWVDNDILVVNPYGTIYIAEVLRKWIISLYSLNLDKEELSECAKNLLKYIKSDKFKNAVQDNIHRTRELSEMLKKEIKTHMNIWKSREFHYSKISENSKSVELDSSEILRNENKIVIEIEKEPEILIIPKKKKKTKFNS
jgi:hypothetical protein